MDLSIGIWKSLKRIALIFGGTALLVLITSAINRKRNATIVATRVVVQPLDGNVLLIDSADVVRIITRSWGEPLNGKQMSEVDADRIERFLEEDPFVRNAEVAIMANNKVFAKVEQRKPLLRILDQDEQQYYLDVSGYRMPLSKHFTARTLVASGKIPPFTEDFAGRKRHLLKDLFELARFISDDPLWEAMFEQVFVNSRDEFVLVPKVGDQLVIVGKAENLESKFRRLRIFYRRVLNQEGWRKYSTIDLRYRGQVVCERS